MEFWVGRLQILGQSKSWVSGPPILPGFQGDYFAVHPTLDKTLVKFDTVFNHGGITLNSISGVIDLGQSAAQIKLLVTHSVDLADPDFVSLLNTIEAYVSKGYKVVGTGHSQGTLYMDLAYQGIQDKAAGFAANGTNDSVMAHVPSITSLPDNTKLEIVNIASPYNVEVDGNGMYTTQCDDIIYTVVSSSFSPNINNNGPNCPAISLGSSDLHQLASYLANGSRTQKQIYADMDIALGLSALAWWGRQLPSER